MDYNFKVKKDFALQKRISSNTYSDFFEKYSDDEFDFKFNNGKEGLKKWLFEKKISHYNANLASLKSVLLNIIILVTLGVLVIFYRPKGIEVSFVKLSIPEELLYIIIAFGIIYSWSNFGLEFNSSLDSRLSLHHNLKSIVGPNIYSAMNYEQKPIHILTDNALIDNWCTFFFDIYKNEGLDQNPKIIKPVQILGLFGLYGTLLGTLFAVFFVNSIEFSVRKPKFRKVARIILVFGFSLIFLTNIGWVENHSYSSFFSAFFWLISSLLIYLWQYKGIDISNKLQNVSE